MGVAVRGDDVVGKGNFPAGMGAREGVRHRLAEGDRLRRAIALGVEAEGISPFLVIEGQGAIAF